jgi:hypothetical protein
MVFRDGPPYDYGLGPAPGGFHALANSFAFDFCGAVPRNARGMGAITDFLSMVFAQQRRELQHLLLQEQRAMPGGYFRSQHLLHRKPNLSAVVSPGRRRGGERSRSPWRRAEPASRRTKPAGKRASIRGGSSKTIYLHRRTQPRRPPGCWRRGRAGTETGKVVVSSGGCHRGRHRAGGLRHRSMIALRRGAAALMRVEASASRLAADTAHDRTSPAPAPASPSQRYP